MQAAIDAGKLDAGATVDAAALVKAGVLRRAKDGVRLLGIGEFKAKVAFLGLGRLEIGGRGGREGRRLGRQSWRPSAEAAERSRPDPYAESAGPTPI